MKKLPDMLLSIGAISLVVGIISRYTLIPVRGIKANAFLEFGGVCALYAIALILKEK